MGIGKDLTAAGGAEKGLHGLLVFFRPGLTFLGFFPGEGFFGLLLAFVKGGYCVNFKGISAVFTGQLLHIFRKNKSGIAAGTFIFKNIGICRQKNPSFLCITISQPIWEINLQNECSF